MKIGTASPLVKTMLFKSKAKLIKAGPNPPKLKLTSSKKSRLRNNNLFYTLQCEGYFFTYFVTMLAINAVRINNINPKPIIITAGDDFVSLRKCQFAAKIPK